MSVETGSNKDGEQQKKGKLGTTAKVSLGILGGLSLLMGYIARPA